MKLIEFYSLQGIGLKKKRVQTSRTFLCCKWKPSSDQVGISMGYMDNVMRYMKKKNGSSPRDLLVKFS